MLFIAKFGSRALFPLLLPCLVFLIQAGQTAWSAQPDTPGKRQAAEQIPRLTPGDLSSLIQNQNGKVTVITVFASWCPPCREEFPMLVALRKEMEEKDLFLVGISADEDFAMLKAFLARQKVNFPIYSGTPAVFKTMSVSEIPHLFIFNRKGVLTESIVGSLSEAQLKTILQRLLSEPNA